MPLPTTTAAAVLTAHGTPLELRQLPLPTDLAPGAALVRVTCATLCGTDVEIWSGKMSFPGMLPLVLGHETVGEVVAVGTHARDALGASLRIGDRIGWSESVCGACYGCTVLRQPVMCAQRGYGFLQRADTPPFAIGGLSEYATVLPGAQKLRLPDDVPDAWAAMAGCAAKTVLRAFDRAGGVRPGDRVVVQGAGALGLFATAVARISGAGTVITVGAPRERLRLATRFGATHTISIDTHHSEDIVASVHEITGGRGANLVLDVAGAPSVGPEAVGMAAQRGSVVIVGSTGSVGEAIPLATVMGKELTILGSLNGDISDYAHAIEFFQAWGDRFPWDELFSAPCGLDEAGAHLAAMHQLSEVKALIDPRRAPKNGAA